MIKKWKKNLPIVLAFATLPLALGHAQSDSAELVRGPAAERFGFTIGAFFSKSDTSVRLGDGLGLQIDLEDTLGFKSRTNVFRTETFWRFASNNKHRLDASWFALRRSANTTVGQDFDIIDRNGNKVTIPTGSNVESHLDIDILELAYSYSFIQDQRIDMAGIGGLYIMPTDFGLKSTGLIDTSKGFNFTAPLPVIGLRVDAALWPKWYFRSSTQLFALSSTGFSGRLMQLRGAIEYDVTHHLALGTGLDTFDLSIDGKGAHFPGIDFAGKLDYRYTGLQLYAKYFF